MEAAGGGKRNAIEETKHSRRAFGMIVAPRGRDHPRPIGCVPRNSGIAGSSTFPRVRGRRQATRRCRPWAGADVAYLIQLYWYSAM